MIACEIQFLFAKKTCALKQNKKNMIKTMYYL